MNHEITLKWDEQGRTKTGRTKAVRVFQKINNLLEKKDTVQFLSNPPHGRLFVVFPAGSPFAENNKHHADLPRQRFDSLLGIPDVVAELESQAHVSEVDQIEADN